jgi:hypothetical protein
MPVGADRLEAMIDDRNGAPVDSDRPVPFPRPDQVGYARPNPSGARKKCGNCYKFVEGGTCIEVAGKIDPGQVCGYHHPGVPFPAGAVPPAGLARRMSPRIAGLIWTPDGEGTSCNNCQWYGATQGMGDNAMDEIGACARVAGEHGTPPATVEALGCCMAWDDGAQRVDAG